MTTADRAGCPGAEQLAAYADGVLSEADRQSLERHLVTCADCRTELAETMALLQTQQVAAPRVPSRVVPFRARRWVTGVAAALAVAAALVIVVRVARPSLLDGWFGPRSDRPELQELVAALANEPTRPVEGRLTGGFKYAPPPSPTRGPGDRDVSPDVRIAAAKIEKAELRDDSPRTQAELGVAYLAMGQLQKAVAALERATAAAPSDARSLSDLSAAYLASATLEQHFEHLPRALEAAEKAVAANPSSVEALFNHALALQLNHLSEEAKAAWQRYLAKETSREWRDEANRYLLRLTRTAGRATEWEGIHHSLMNVETQVDATTLRSISALFPRATRETVLDELLPAWGGAIERGDWPKADKFLTRIRAVAESVALVQGPHVRDVVADIANQDRLSQVDIARGCRDYGDARQLERSEERSRASKLFDSARGIFERQQQFSLTDWSALGVASAASDRHDLAAADLILRESYTRAERRGDAALVASLAMMRGVVEAQRSAYLASLDAFQHAVDGYESIREVDGVVSAHAQMAYVFRVLGDRRSEWLHRARALENRPSIIDQSRQYLVTFGTSTSLAEEGLYHASRRFGEAARVAAVATGSAMKSSEVSAVLARVYRDLDAHAEAATALRQSKRDLERVPDPVFREGLRARVLLNEMETPTGKTVALAKTELNTALEYFSDRNREDFIPLIYLARGRLSARAGESQAARTDFEKGIQLLERRARFLRVENRDLPLFDRSWELFGEMIDLSDPSGSLPGDGLAYAEHLHSLNLASSSEETSPTIDVLIRQVPHDVAVLYFTVRPASTAVWIIASGRVERVRLVASSADLERRIQRLISFLEQGSPRDVVEQSSGQLFDDLIAPITSRFGTARRLVVVPDGALYRLPFAVLWNPRTRKYLVQDYTIVAASSLRSFAMSSHPRSRTGFVGRSVTVAGNPTGQREPLDNRRELAGSDDESREIRRLYGTDAMLLTGRDVTKKAFLSSIARSEVVHFAGHAVANPQAPALAHLILADDGDPENRFLFAHEIRRLSLGQTRLVVLAACETAVGGAAPGAGMFSLANAFLESGVAAVVGTLWRVDDTSSHPFGVAFHRRLLRLRDPIEALRQTQIEWIDHQGQSGRSDWAAYQVVGGRTVL